MKKYQAIYITLKERILDGTYAIDSLLPTEEALQEDYQVSRDTVRKALALLTEQGLVQKVQGRGTQVIKREQVQFPVSGLTSYQEVATSLGLNSQTSIRSLEQLEITERLQEVTGFAAGTLVWKLVRTRTIDGQVVVLDTDYLLCEVVPELPLERIKDSLYAYLEGDLGLDISYAQKEITIQPATQVEKELMQLTEDYLVSVKSPVFLGNTQQFQYTESRHKMDKFIFVDFARRKHSL